MKTMLNSKQKHVFLPFIQNHRLFAGQFATSYQNTDNKDNPSQTLIAVPWQHSQKILALAGGKGEIQHTKLEKDLEKSVCWRDRGERC